ncbi:MAG: DEAD/DEAH box helicase [Candidatus Thorarchaeota archaeon]
MNVFELLHDRIREVLADRGIVEPTPIQVAAIPEILRSRDNFLIVAPTGSGKTEAALLPLLSKMLEQTDDRSSGGVRLLYITPLRALNRDLLERIERICTHVGLSVSVRHGDTSQHFRKKQLENPPDLLILTPETLQAIIPAPRMQMHIRNVRTAVIDEVHELAGSKRGVQLSLGLERLERIAGSRIQRIGLSATVGNPRTVAGWLGGTDQYVRIIWGGFESRRMILRVEMPVPDDEDMRIAREIKVSPYNVARLKRILDLINTHSSTLIFTNTRSFAELLGLKMRVIDPSLKLRVHHGSLSKSERLEAEDEFKNGSCKAMIATSSLELGIDIGQADLVVQYSSPRNVSRELQRAGRASHRVGGAAEGVVIATMNLDDVTESGVIVRRAILNKVEHVEIPMESWDVLCHQICGAVLDSGSVSLTELLEMTRETCPFRMFNRSHIERLIEFMKRRSLISVIGDRVAATRRTRKFYYEHLGTIPDVRQVPVLDILTRRTVGVLDEEYVKTNVAAGTSLVIAGRTYDVVSIDEEVLCRPAVSTDTAPPRWTGEMIPVPYEVAVEVSSVWNHVATMTKKRACKWLEKRYRLTKEAAEYVIQCIDASMHILGVIPSVKRVVIESTSMGLVVHVPLGTRANETLGLLLSALLSTRHGIDIGMESDPYRILLSTSQHIDPSEIECVLKGLEAAQTRTLLRLALKNTDAFLSRFAQVAKRMGVIEPEASSNVARNLIRLLRNTPVFDEALNEVLFQKTDEKRVIEFLEDCRNGRIQFQIVIPASMSPLAQSIVEGRSRFELVGETLEEEEILALLERRLLSTELRLQCRNCSWSAVRKVYSLDEIVTCPTCLSRMISVFKIRRGDQKDSTYDGRRNRVSSNRLVRQMDLTAQLVAEYGKRAVMVLAGRGIGPTMASRILSPSRMDRVSLLRAIAAAEEQYARTRGFW